MQNKNGFTFLEVIMSLAILTMILFPFVNTLPNYYNSMDAVNTYKKLYSAKSAFYAELARILFFTSDSNITFSMNSDVYPIPLAGSPTTWDEKLNATLPDGISLEITSWAAPNPVPAEYAACVVAHDYETLADWQYFINLNYRVFEDLDSNNSYDAGEKFLSGEWFFVRPNEHYAALVEPFHAGEFFGDGIEHYRVTIQ